MRTVVIRRPRPSSVPGRGIVVVRRRWLAAWFGLAALGVANGTVREVAYADTVGDHTAHQMSTFTLIAMIAGYTWWLQRRWPLTSTADALRIGALWVTMTIAFEFGFGHYVDGAPWSTLLTDYDLTRGNLWLLVLGAVALAPALTRRGRRFGPARVTVRPGADDGSARRG